MKQKVIDCSFHEADESSLSDTNLLESLALTEDDNASVVTQTLKQYEPDYKDQSDYNLPVHLVMMDDMPVSTNNTGSFKKRYPFTKMNNQNVNHEQFKLMLQSTDVTRTEDLLTQKLHKQNQFNDHEQDEEDGTMADSHSSDCSGLDEGSITNQMIKVSNKEESPARMHLDGRESRRGGLPLRVVSHALLKNE